MEAIKMAHYKNQEEMFQKRAENNKKSGDKYYAMGMQAKENGDDKKYKQYMAQAKNQYKMQDDNERKAQEHAGKSW